MELLAGITDYIKNIDICRKKKYLMGRMNNLSKIKTVRILSALLIITLVMSCSLMQAQATRVFTDVGDGQWYDVYILKAYEAGLIVGSNDAFRPNESIDKVSVIICLSRMMGISNEPNLDTYRTKYSAKMDAYKIPVWAKEFIAYALEKGIIQEDELATFVKSDGTNNNAKRYEVAVYFARTLGLEQEAKALGDVILDFKDNELISKFARGYIKVLMDRGIISGDTEGKFNPNNEITRAAIATMLAKSLDVVGNVPEEDTTEIEGIIEEIISGTGRTIIKLSTADGNIDIYDASPDVSVKLDGSTAVLTDISAGQQAAFMIKAGEIVSIDVVSKTEEVKGIIISALNMAPSSLITIEDEEGDKHTYKVEDNAVIKLDGNTVFFEYLKSGDKVTVTVKNGYATIIEAESKTKTALGVFGGFKTETELVLILKKGDKEIEYSVDDDADVERDGKEKGLDDLRKGDEIEITTEYGVVTHIKADSVDKEVTGTIYSLLIARPHQLTILNEDGETETFIIAVDVDIEIDDKTASIYDLRLDYEVEVEVESDEIVSIEAESVVSQNETIGTVEYVNEDVNVITLKVLDASTNTYVLKQINTNDDTEIMDTDRDRRYLRHIDEGDRLIVIGHSELGVFIAETIIITNR